MDQKERESRIGTALTLAKNAQAQLEVALPLGEEAQLGMVSSALWKLVDAAGLLGVTLPFSDIQGLSIPTGRGYRIVKEDAWLAHMHPGEL